MIANKFDHQFTPPPIRLTGNKSKRKLKRQFHQLPLIGTPSFWPADTKEAIRLAKSSTAIGPIGISTLHLKNLAQGAISYFINIFNLNWTDTRSMAITIPILKPGKDHNIGHNWRPISLRCPAAKTLENLLLPEYWHTSLSTLLNMAFGRNTRHALHCRRSPPILQPASQEKAGSPNSACRARSDSCIRQCGPSATARLCPQHQHSLNNPSLALQLYAEQTSQSSFSAKRI